jgi:hypothetical protein
MTLAIILLVLFILCLACWAAINAGALQGNPMWFAFAAVLILGVVVFLSGFGLVVIRA